MSALRLAELRMKEAEAVAGAFRTQAARKFAEWKALQGLPDFGQFSIQATAYRIFREARAQYQAAVQAWRKAVDDYEDLKQKESI